MVRVLSWLAQCYAPGEEHLHTRLAGGHRSSVGTPLLRESMVRLGRERALTVRRGASLPSSGQVIHHLVRYGVAEAAVKLTIHFTNLSLHSAPSLQKEATNRRDVATCCTTSHAGFKMKSQGASASKDGLAS